MGASSDRSPTAAQGHAADGTDTASPAVLREANRFVAGPLSDAEPGRDTERQPTQVVEPNTWSVNLHAGPHDAEPETVDSEEATRIPLRLVLVDDSPIFLGTLRRLLDTLPDIDVVASSTSGRDALELLDWSSPDVLLMDLAMPDMDGLEVSRRIRDRAERPKIIIMSIHDLPRYRVEARTAGADAFITKSDLVNQLQPLMRHLLDQADAGWTEP
jgi:CheY-like chemotaxis protein